MRVPFLSLVMKSPFVGIHEHVDKILECGELFRRGMDAYLDGDLAEFERLRETVDGIESDADAVKRRIRGHLPKGTLMPVDKFQVFRYLREQDQVIDSFENSLNWISFRTQPAVPAEVLDDFRQLVASVMPLVDALARMVVQAQHYFQSFSEKQRRQVKEIIRELHRLEHAADEVEHALKRKIFATVSDAVTIMHLVRLAETIGDVADHAQNAGDMMRAMVAK